MIINQDILCNLKGIYLVFPVDYQRSEPDTSYYTGYMSRPPKLRV